MNRALATLQYTRKGVGHDITKLLRSAIANAQQKDGFGGDVDRLDVSACYANQGPSMKRIRPAPMGRAFRVVKRTAHLTVHVAERALDIAPIVPEPAPKRGEKAPAAKAKAAPKAAAKKAQAPARKKAEPAKKSAAPKKK